MEATPSPGVIAGAAGRTDCGGDSSLSVGDFDAKACGGATTVGPGTVGGARGTVGAVAAGALAVGLGAAGLTGAPMLIVGAAGRACDFGLPPISIVRETMTDGGAATGAFGGGAAGFVACASGLGGADAPLPSSGRLVKTLIAEWRGYQSLAVHHLKVKGPPSIASTSHHRLTEIRRDHRVTRRGRSGSGLGQCVEGDGIPPSTMLRVA
jgi:hypothetical protein